MVFDDYYITGHLNQIGNLASHCVSELLRSANVRELKIGVTSDPNRRMSVYKKDGWRYMYLIYRTSSRDYACRLESYLIDKYRHRLANQRRGGGGNVPIYYDRFWVYAVAQ